MRYVVESASYLLGSSALGYLIVRLLRADRRPTGGGDR